MKDRLNKAAQYALPPLQVYKRPANAKYAEPPMPYQHWMCPACDEHHIKQPYNMTHYRCSCGWNGDRNALLTSDLSCMVDEEQLNAIILGL